MSETVLLPPSPNPATGCVRFRFMPPRSSDLRMAICDIAGRHIRHLPHRSIGSETHTVCWDGRDDGGRFVPSGVYFVHAAWGGRAEAARFVLLQSQSW